MEGLNGADMVFVIFSAALVMFMVPGLHYFMEVWSRVKAFLQLLL